MSIRRQEALDYHVGGAEAIGSILVGMAQPVHSCSGAPR
jgi:hypothetical protein